MKVNSVSKTSKASTSRKRMVTRESHLPSIQEALGLMGERMIQLANELAEDGLRPLTKDEEELIRVSRLPILTEIFNDLKMQYLATGYMDTYEFNQFKEY